MSEMGNWISGWSNGLRRLARFWVTSAVSCAFVFLFAIALAFAVALETRAVFAATGANVAQGVGGGGADNAKTATAARQIVLKPRSVIDHDTILIGDLWLGVATKLANRVVEAAPAVGRTKVFTMQQLQEIAKTHGLNWQPDSPMGRVVVQRSAYLVNVPVLVSPMPRGGVISASDLGFMRMAAEQVNSQTITDSTILIGKMTKRAIVALQPIRITDLENAVLVKRNSLVTVQLVTGGMSVMMQATALEDGSEGQMIRIQNSTSRKIFQATVRGVGFVMVSQYSHQLGAVPNR